MGDVAERWCEGALVSDKSVVVESICQSLLAPTKVARSIASGFALEDSEEAATACFDNKGKFILGNDAMFKIDMCFWRQHLGDGAVAKYQAAILRCFHSGGARASSFVEVMENLSLLE